MKNINKIICLFVVSVFFAGLAKAEMAPARAAKKMQTKADVAQADTAPGEKPGEQQVKTAAKPAAKSEVNPKAIVAAEIDTKDDANADSEVEADVEVGIPPARPQSDQDYVVKRVLQADIATSINPGSKNFMLKSIREAERRGFDMVLFRLDTPGGLLDSTRDIVKGMMAAKIPVAVFVGPPVTVSGGGGGGDDDKKDNNSKHLAEKAEQDTRAFIEGIAAQRHRNKAWARKAVLRSVSIVSDRALQLGVIDLIARDVDELLKKADGISVEVDGQWKTLRCQGALIEHTQMSTGDSLVNLFSNPNISYLLFMAGLLGIAMELYHPGVIFPGVLGGISLILAFISFQLVPINIGGLLLILLGTGLLVAEAFLPSFGALGIGGAASLALGGTLLVDDMNPGLWADPEYGVSPWTLWPTILVVLGLLGLVGHLVYKSRRQSPVTGRIGMLGMQALALTDIGPEGGRAQLGPETWRARSAQPIAKGQALRVVAVQGLLLQVEALEQAVKNEATTGGPDSLEVI